MDWPPFLSSAYLLPRSSTDNFYNRLKNFLFGRSLTVHSPRHLDRRSLSVEVSNTDPTILRGPEKHKISKVNIQCLTKSCDKQRDLPLTYI